MSRLYYCDTICKKVYKQYFLMRYKLKAIKYEDDYFCYWFSYLPDLSLQAACFLILFFRPHAFKTSYLLRNAFVHLNLRSQICSNNLNFYLLSLLLTQWSTFHSNQIDQIPGSRIRYVQRVDYSTTRMVISKA